MHQDIRTFSEALDIKTADKLQVELEVEAHGHVEYRMRLNGHLILDPVTCLTLDLLSPVSLTCRVTHIQNGGALEIKKFNINGQEVLPKYQHLASPKTAWLDQIGMWEFHTDRPFYPWFHAISGQGWVA
jgi:hypothetical protein